MLYGNRGIVPEADYEVPFGHARQTRAAIFTVVGISHMVVECLRAAQVLKDIKDFGRSDRPHYPRTARYRRNFGIGPEIWSFAPSSTRVGPYAAREAKLSRGLSKKPASKASQMKRGLRPGPLPDDSTPLEDIYYRTEQTITEAAHQLLRSGKEWSAPETSSSEVLEFRDRFEDVAA